MSKGSDHPDSAPVRFRRGMQVAVSVLVLLAVFTLGMLASFSRVNS